MSTWWNVSTGWAEWFHLQGGVAANGATVTAIARYPGHLDVFTVGTDNRVYSVWWDAAQRLVELVPVGGQTARPNSTVTVVARYPDQLDLFTTASNGRDRLHVVERCDGLGHVVPGLGRRGLERLDGQRHRPAPQPPRPVRHRHRQPHLQHLVARHDRLGRLVQRLRRRRPPGGHVAAIARMPEHIDLFTVGSDGIVYSTWWDGATGWAGWFGLGVSGADRATVLARMRRCHPHADVSNPWSR